MTIIELLLWFYLAMLATVVVHELGHQGKRFSIEKWFPWVEGASYETKYRYGGLIVNVAIGALVYSIKPEHIFFQLFGLLNWFHFSVYAIFGSFNYEPKVPPHLWKYFVFDDVPNSHWVLFTSLGAINLLLFQSYYLPLIVDVFKNLL